MISLQLFLRKNSKLGRLPDFIVVEGPLAGGHLGFGMDWAQYDLFTIFTEIRQYLKDEHLDIAVIPAGGIFTGSDAAEFLEAGAGVGGCVNPRNSGGEKRLLAGCKRKNAALTTMLQRIAHTPRQGCASPGCIRPQPALDPASGLFSNILAKAFSMPEKDAPPNLRGF